MVTATVDFSVNDSPQSVLAFLRRTEKIRAPDVVEWTIDLRNCHYMGPDAVALLVAELLNARGTNKRGHMLLPSDPPALDAFLAFSGLKHLLDPAQPQPADHPESMTIPVQVQKKSGFLDADPIVALIRNHASISEDAEEYLRICVNEVLQNVQDHSNSPIGSVTCARYFKNTKQVRVAIVDRGLGICATLRRTYSYITSGTSALRSVLEGGYSAKSRPNNMGLGLSNLCSILMNQLGGELFILSDDAFADGKPGRQPILRPVQPRFGGTAVFFSVPVQ